VLFEVKLNVRREEPEHFVFDYKNADWALFRLDSLMDLNFSLDRVASGAVVDSMIWTFTGVILEARAVAVPLVSPRRFCLALSPQIKSIKAQKMAGSVSGKTAVIHRIGWSSKHITILFGTSI
jgi:hypothetical protein